MTDVTAREASSLHGKQLVFLFMSVVVLAVVIFLCGVMVGRGVRDARAPVEVADDVDPTIADDPTVEMAAPPASDETAELQYPKDLTVSGPPPDPPLEPVDETPAERRAAPAPPSARQESRIATAPRRSEDAVTAPAPGAADSAFREPPGAGFVVQVHAARQRAEAVGIAKRLAAKGYQAFVTTAGTGPAMMYRVRVGKFPDRAAAKAVSDKLEAEERFKPWITR